jgi:hypothetical protein
MLMLLACYSRRAYMVCKASLMSHAPQVHGRTQQAVLGNQCHATGCEQQQQQLFLTASPLVVQQTHALQHSSCAPVLLAPAPAVSILHAVCTHASCSRRASRIIIIITCLTQSLRAPHTLLNAENVHTQPLQNAQDASTHLHSCYSCRALAYAGYFVYGAVL